MPLMTMCGVDCWHFLLRRVRVASGCVSSHLLHRGIIASPVHHLKELMQCATLFRRQMLYKYTCWFTNSSRHLGSNSDPCPASLSSASS